MCFEISPANVGVAASITSITAGGSRSIGRPTWGTLGAGDRILGFLLLLLRPPLFLSSLLFPVYSMPFVSFIFSFTSSQVVIGRFLFSDSVSFFSFFFFLFLFFLLFPFSVTISSFSLLVLHFILFLYTFLCFVHTFIYTTNYLLLFFVQYLR